MRVLTGTGPLVAILSATDQYHETCLQTVQSLRGPLLTCWPVITEAAWLLQSTPLGFEKLLRSISDGAVEILPVAGKEASAVAEIMKKDGNLRSQFADSHTRLSGGARKHQNDFHTGPPGLLRLPDWAQGFVSHRAGVETPDNIRQ